MTTKIESEDVWLRFMIGRLRVAARYVKMRQVEEILRELIRDAEARLSAIEDARRRDRPLRSN